MSSSAIIPPQADVSSLLHHLLPQAAVSIRLNRIQDASGGPVPALPDVPGVIRCQLDWQIGSDAAALSRFFVTYTGTVPSVAAMEAFASNLAGECDDVLPPLMHSDTSFLGCTLTDLSSPTGATHTQIEDAPGTRSGDQLGADVCALGNIPIGRRYRGGKPRLYWPLGTSTDLQTRQTWTTDAIAAFQSGFNAVVGQLDGVSADGTSCGIYCNVSYYGPPNRIITGSTGRVRTVSTVRTDPIVDVSPGPGISCNSHLASQRRRNLIRS
jgi:hypothetical protein